METLGGRLLQHAHEPVLCIGLRRALGGATAAIAARISKALRAGTSRKNVCYSRFLPSRWSTRWLADDNVALLGMGFTTTSATSVWVFLTLALKTQACCKIDESREHWFIALRFVGVKNREAYHAHWRFAWTKDIFTGKTCALENKSKLWDCPYKWLEPGSLLFVKSIFSIQNMK